MKVGFIGQGYIGKGMADDFEERGFDIVRYSLEPAYQENASRISECDIVFVAVPTPTTKDGSDYSTVEAVLELVGKGKTVVIKSTILPGTTKVLQEKYTDRTVLFSPEFLSKATAAEDAAHPIFTIIGLPEDTDTHHAEAKKVCEVLPKTDQTFVTSSNTAEQFKYIHNVHGYLRIVFANIQYDLAQQVGAHWQDMQEMMNADPMMSPFYNDPFHGGARGAGGCCFIKDMAAFTQFFSKECSTDDSAIAFLKALEKKNLELLKQSHKSADIVDDVYRPTASA